MNRRTALELKRLKVPDSMTPQDDFRISKPRFSLIKWNCSLAKFNTIRREFANKSSSKKMVVCIQTSALVTSDEYINSEIEEYRNKDIDEKQKVKDSLVKKSKEVNQVV